MFKMCAFNVGSTEIGEVADIFCTINFLFESDVKLNIKYNNECMTIDEMNKQRIPTLKTNRNMSLYL